MRQSRKSPTKSQIINFKLLDLLPTMNPDQQLEVFERVIKILTPHAKDQGALASATSVPDEAKAFVVNWLNERYGVSLN